MDRRQFLRHTSAVALGFSGLRTAVARGRTPQTSGDDGPGYGPLVPDPQGLLDLPAGFAYVQISVQGTAMSDGLVVPGNHDGMAAFVGSAGRIVLVRNHEFTSSTSRGAFGPSNQLLSLVPPQLFYDYGYGVTPALGGTTTVVYDPVLRRVDREFLSLAGTMRNCAGGVTPWGSWLSCEESVQRPDARYEKDHGYLFEVPALATGPVIPTPLLAMGRFNREAAVVDSRTGIVYMTEDRSDGLLYRFVPNMPGRLFAGGRLQALVVAGRFALDTTNTNPAAQIPVGAQLDIVWVDLDNPMSPNDDLRVQGAAKGAAVFARGEGMWWGRDELYFTCTSGGLAGEGQVWRLRPSPIAVAGVSIDMIAGQLELFLEPNDSSVLDNADNLTIAPWGELFVCEDGSGSDRVLGVTQQGQVFDFARNAASTSEMAGVVFSPDGKVLFVNVQRPGYTFAITGPW